jgi:hypothetical protein
MEGKVRAECMIFMGGLGGYSKTSAILIKFLRIPTVSMNLFRILSAKNELKKDSSSFQAFAHD